MKAKKMLSLLTLIVMFLSIFPTVHASVSGICGDDITWVLSDNGTLTISGNGEMYNYGFGYTDLEGEKENLYNGEVPWYTYQNDIKSVIVEPGVTRIGAFAFEFFKNATSISLPDGLKSIGTCAFAVCKSLEEINIPETVEKIGDSVFTDLM